MIDDPEFANQLTASLRPLRRFGRSLCHDPGSVDDLVQQTVLQAWAVRGRLRSDSRVRSWLFTILRNCYYAELRRRKREVADSAGKIAATVMVTADHDFGGNTAAVYAALQALPHEQREALTLVVNRGLSYAQVSRICGCTQGTIKSRVFRARMQLRRLLDGLAADDGHG
jgi:RNA polymerase sigma-70 factor (ECF subfamily)